MKINRSQEIRTDLRLTPLIDVVLLLLIFFLLTSTFVSPSAVQVDPPKTDTGSVGKQTPAALTISENGTLYFNDEERTLDELRDELEGVQTVTIRGDTRSNLGTFIKVWELLKEKGIKQTYVQVEPKSKSTNEK